MLPSFLGLCFCLLLFSLHFVSFLLLSVAFCLLFVSAPSLALTEPKGREQNWEEGREQKWKEGAKIECEKDKGNRNKGTEMHGEDGGRGASQSLGWHHFWVSVSVCFCFPCTLFLFSFSPLLSVYHPFLRPPLFSLSQREGSRTERKAGNTKGKKERR